MTKEQVKQAAMAIASQKAATARQAMENAQQAANAEGKSSVGDKYETTRAMMQIERDRAAQQLDLAQRLMHDLNQAMTEPQTGPVRRGSLLKVSGVWYWLVTGLGPVIIDNQTVMVISMASPLGALLNGKTMGDVIELNGRQLQIESIS